MQAEFAKQGLTEVAVKDAWDDLVANGIQRRALMVHGGAITGRAVARRESAGKRALVSEHW